MELALAMLSFVALVVSWFVLPAAPRTQTAATVAAADQLPTAA
jgi:hypothetical protein